MGCLRFGKWSSLVRVSEADFLKMMNSLKTMHSDLNLRMERLGLDNILQTDLDIFRAWIGTSEMVTDWLYDLTGDDVLGPVVSSILAFLGLRWVNDGTLNMVKV